MPAGRRAAGRSVAEVGQAGVDPRISARRSAVAQRRSRRRVRLVLAALLLVIAGCGAWYALHSRLFAARVVTVVGSSHTPVAEIERVAGVAGHPPLLDVAPAVAAARLERLPWVRTATVVREWPDGLRIEVTERVAVAAVATTTATGAPATGSSGSPPAASSWALVDRAGRVLATTASPPAGTVKLVGPAVPGRPGTAVRADRPALKVAVSLPKAFAAQVVAVRQDAAGTVTLQLTTPVTVALGAPTELQQKYEDVAALLAGAPLAAGDVLDVSVPGAPVVTGPS